MTSWRWGAAALAGFVVGTATGLWIGGPPTAGAGPGPVLAPAAKAPAPPDDGKLRILCFGAHPDDCELRAGGVAALWAAQGHHVKFVSVTNGDIGHWRDAGGPLARRRKAESSRPPGFSVSPRRCSTSTTASFSPRSRTAGRSRG